MTRAGRILGAMPGTTEPPPLSPAVPTQVTCPGCGVAVAVGYPRCPRCHATVPSAPRSKRATFREEALAGGTSLAPPDDEPGPPVGCIAFGVVLLVVGVIAIWLATRDRTATPAVTDDETEDVEEAAEPVEPDEETPVEGAGPATGTADEDVEEGPDIEEVARDLDAALRGAQLWSKVTVDGDVVVIESSLCDDPGVWGEVKLEAVALRDAGTVSVRCQEPHGGVVFDRKL